MRDSGIEAMTIGSTRNHLCGTYRCFTTVIQLQRSNIPSKPRARERSEGGAASVDGASEEQESERESKSEKELQA